MKVNLSKATFSSIVGIGQKVKKAAEESGEDYLELNRGVNSVVNIDLSNIKLNFNDKEMQLYAPNKGIGKLKETISQEYFSNKNNVEDIFISPGGMPALDLIMQILNVDNIYFPKFYWGSYSKIATIRNKQFSFYDTLMDFDIDRLDENTCIFICDPSNPTGIKLEDEFLLKKIKEINNTGAIVVFDSPYRKLFYNDDFFEKLLLPNVIITESFSKWVGLPGARLGFIHSSNKEFNDELNIRLLYEFNGVSSFSQLLINEILSTPQGKLAINNFQIETRKSIHENIEFLKETGLLANEIYSGKLPMGIFAVINKSEDYLFRHRIGAVGLDKFVYHDKDIWSSYSRICVSVENMRFLEFMQHVI